MSELLATAAAHGLIAALGAAILHSIWQITIVAAAVAAMLAVMKRATPDARYLVACAGLALSLALPMATVVTRISAAPVVAPTAAEEATLAGASHNPAVAMSEARRRDAVGPRWLPGAGGAVDARLPWLVAAWAAGVMLLSIRLLGGWIGVVRLARRSVCEPRADWRASFERVLARMQMRRAVRLVESVAVSVPTAIGWIRPVVLLPAAALAGLTPAQVEAIIAHELAHVRRFDYLVNVCQAAIETLLFYHPGVWWLSRAIRAEREHCCDDAAVRLVGDALGYARALTRLEEQRDRAVALALAATGGPFMNRIKRLRPTGAARTPWPVPLAILLVLVAVVAGGAVVASPAYVPSRPAATVAPPQSLGADVRNTVRPGSLADDIGNELRQLWVRFRRRVNNFAAQAAAQSAAPKPSPAPKAKPAPGPKPTPAPAPDEAAQRPAAPKVDFDFDAIFADVERTLREAELHYGTAMRELEREFTPEKQAETRRALEEARRQMARVTRDMARHRADYARVMRDYERQARELSREQVQKELKNHREDIERALRDYRRQMREYTRQLRDSEQRAEGQETPRPPVPPAPPVSRAPQMAPPVPPEPPRPTPAPQLALPAPPAAPAPLSPSPRGRRSRVLPPPLPPPAPTAVAPTPAPAPPARLAPPAPSTPPPAPTAMAPPAPPPPPASPARPAPPAPPVPLSLLWQSSEQAETHISRSDDGRTLDVRAKGRVETSDDDSDIKRLSPGGYFIISDRTGGKTVTFEARAVNGSIERKWTGLTGATERRQWLADHLAELRRR